MLAEFTTERKLSIPIVVLIVFITWALSAGVTYGVISTRLDWQAQRLDSLERTVRFFVPRPEYDAAQNELDKRLDRIERKIDNLR